MDPNIENQDRFYRRGLVLGLTMAEIMVLTLFALLLALAAAMAKKDAIIKDYSQLRETFAAIVAGDKSGMTATDVLKAIQRQKTEIADLHAEVDRLRDYEQKAKLAEDVFQELRRGGIDKPDTPEGIRSLGDKLKIAREAMNTAKAAGANLSEGDVADRLRLANTVMEAAKTRDGAKPDPQRITELIKGAQDADRRYRDLLGQNKNLEGQLNSLTAGKGGQLPPCWASADTGKAEYIFDVTINSTGLIVSSNAAKPEMQYRAAQYAELPISMIQFDKELSESEFRQETDAIRRWGDGQEQQCRFFVRLIDATKPDEKATFKRLMLTTGEGFYYWLVR